MAEPKKVVSEKETEISERTQAFIKEINEAQDKHELAFVAKLKYTEGGIVPEIGIADTKKVETVADKIK